MRSTAEARRGWLMELRGLGTSGLVAASSSSVSDRKLAGGSLRQPGQGKNGGRVSAVNQGNKVAGSEGEKEQQHDASMTVVYLGHGRARRRPRL